MLEEKLYAEMRHIFKLKKIIDKIQDDIHDLQIFKSAKIKMPYKCPICDGKGTFQSLQSSPPYVLHNICETCEGKKVIWG